MSRKRRKAKPAAAAGSLQSSRRPRPAAAPELDRRIAILPFAFFVASWIIMVLVPVRPLKIVGATFLALCLSIWLYIIWVTGEIRTNWGTVRRQTHPRLFLCEFLFLAAVFTVFAGFWFYVAIRAAFYPSSTPPAN
ncbi:MAG: hypothetical protein U0795_04165 [Pirellulales bacterium]